MAGLLDSEQKNESQVLRNVLVIAAVLVVAAAVAFFVFYHHENHAEVEAVGVRTLVMPLHLKYGHVGEVVGEDQVEDLTYVVAVLRLSDHTDAPLFIKDIAGNFTTADGGNVEGHRVAERDFEKLYSLVPQLKPVVASAGKPMLPEQTIAKGATAEGYVIYQYSAPQSAWDQRKTASARIDFYHQDSITVALAK